MEFLSENVAKALLTVASVDRVVFSVSVAVQITVGILEKLSGKKCLFQHSEGIKKIINVCKPSPALWCFILFKSVLMFFFNIRIEGRIKAWRS